MGTEERRKVRLLFTILEDRPELLDSNCISLYALSPLDERVLGDGRGRVRKPPLPGPGRSERSLRSEKGSRTPIGAGTHRQFAFSVLICALPPPLLPPSVTYFCWEGAGNLRLRLHTAAKKSREACFFFPWSDGHPFLYGPIHPLTFSVRRLKDQEAEDLLVNRSGFTRLVRTA